MFFPEAIRMSALDGSRTKRTWRLVMLSVSCCSVFGCSGGTPAPKTALQAEMADLPAWALGNCQESLKDKSMLCGSGSVQGMSNLGLARSAAEGRARTQLARSLQVRVKSMLKDYQAATQGGPANDTASEQHVEDVSKQITDLTLSGTRVDQTFVSDTGTFWALVVLDTQAFKTALNDEHVDDATRQAILARADRSFAELEASSAPP
jgi:hypothetical protein